MADIKLWIHDHRIYQEPHYIAEKDVLPGIKEWGNSVIPHAKEEGKQHCVYATKETDSDGHTIEVNYYCVCLDDKEFFKRTDTVVEDARKKGNDITIYAFHKGTSY